MCLAAHSYCGGERLPGRTPCAADTGGFLLRGVPGCGQQPEAETETATETETDRGTVRRGSGTDLSTEVETERETERSEGGAFAK